MSLRNRQVRHEQGGLRTQPRGAAEAGSLGGLGEDDQALVGRAVASGIHTGLPEVMQA
jgi:hypothetical protein